MHRSLALVVVMLTSSEAALAQTLWDTYNQTRESNQRQSENGCAPYAEPRAKMNRHPRVCASANRQAEVLR